MRRYRLKRGKLREDPDGEWVRAADVLKDRVDAKLLKKLLDERDRVQLDALRWDHVRTHHAKEVTLPGESRVRWAIIHDFPPAATLDDAVDAELAEEVKRIQEAE